MSFGLLDLLGDQLGELRARRRRARVRGARAAALAEYRELLGAGRGEFNETKRRRRELRRRLCRPGSFA